MVLVVIDDLLMCFGFMLAFCVGFVMDTGLLSLFWCYVFVLVGVCVSWVVLFLMLICLGVD